MAGAHNADAFMLTAPVHNPEAGPRSFQLVDRALGHVLNVAEGRSLRSNGNQHSSDLTDMTRPKI